MELEWIFCLLFLCFSRGFAQVQDITRYFAVGKSLELRPPSGISEITGVQWRHNEDIVAEWSKGETKVDSYGDFKNRVDLNTETGVLLIRDMTAALAGVYTIEINNNRLELNYQVSALKEVPKPEVWPKPGKDDSEQELSCKADVSGAEPVTYLWDTAGNRTWTELGKQILIQNNESTRAVEAFSCRVKNPVSEQQSDPKENPFYPKASSQAGLGALVLIPILVLAGLGYWKREDIKKKLCGGEERPTANGNKGEGANEENVGLDPTGTQPGA